MNKVILLTACVNPNGMSNTAIQDIDIRKQQYKDAIDFYLRRTDYGIVFVENSSTDMSQGYCVPISKGRLEMITFEGNNYDRKLGKGYGEAMIIDYVFKHSRLLSGGVNS